MKKKTIVLLILITVSLLLTTVAFAATYANPGELVSGLTGKTQAEVYAERSEGKTFGKIAEENGKLDEFRNEMLEYKKSIIDERIEAGAISEEDGEALKKAMEERTALCSGTPGNNQGCLGQQFGGGMGFGKGQGRGQGRGMGQGQMGMGFGRALR